MSRWLATIIKGTAIFAVLFYYFLAPAHAQEKGQIVLVNNASLKTAEGLTIQILRVNGKNQTLIKNQLVVASDPCTNGCDYPSMSIDDAPGEYKIQVFGGVVLENSAVKFPMHAGDEYVWMISNRANAPQIRAARKADIDVISDKGPFRIDLVTYTKGDVPRDTVAAPHKKAKNPFWPFTPSKKSHINN